MRLLFGTGCGCSPRKDRGRSCNRIKDFPSPGWTGSRHCRLFLRSHPAGDKFIWYARCVSIACNDNSFPIGFASLFSHATGVVELVATAKDGSKKVLKRTVQGYKPTIFEFQGLAADTNYTVDINGPKPLPFARQAFLKTRPIQRGRMLRFATVSCNNVFIGTR